MGRRSTAIIFTNRASRHRRSRRGNAMVEFALAFLVLWFLFSGVFQFG